MSGAKEEADTESLQLEKKSLVQRLLKRNDKHFVKYIGSTTTHGVVHIFSGKSTLRRLFWFFLVLGAASGCFYNIVDRIIYYATWPTQTSVQIAFFERQAFPAVSVCNLNALNRSYVAANNLTELVDYLYAEELMLLEQDDAAGDEPAMMGGGPRQAELRQCPNTTLLQQNVSLNLSALFQQASHLPQSLVLGCSFSGKRCSHRDFKATLTELGLCYTFNSGEDGSEVLEIDGTSSRNSLRLILNVEQDDYVATLNGDAGVKIAVHPQGEPPLPDSEGIAVPPGRQAFIGLKKATFLDQSTRKKCKDESTVGSFHFLHNKYKYSFPACRVDCFYSKLSDKCDCVESSFGTPYDPPYSERPQCSTEHICCVASSYLQPENCTCLNACSFVEYSSSTSYAQFPSNHLLQRFSEISNISTSQIQQNILSVNVYFETLNVNEKVTSDAYSVVSLLSDIGGQLGLFVGASLISFTEFLVWLLDELKDRCCGMSERRINKFIRRHFKRDQVKSSTDEQEMSDKQHNVP